MRSHSCSRSCSNSTRSTYRRLSFKCTNERSVKVSAQAEGRCQASSTQSSYQGVAEQAEEKDLQDSYGFWLFVLSLKKKVSWKAWHKQRASSSSSSAAATKPKAKKKYKQLLFSTSLNMRLWSLSHNDRRRWSEEHQQIQNQTIIPFASTLTTIYHVQYFFCFCFCFSKLQQQNSISYKQLN